MVGIGVGDGVEFLVLGRSIFGGDDLIRSQPQLKERVKTHTQDHAKAGLRQIEPMQRRLGIFEERRLRRSKRSGSRRRWGGKGVRIFVGQREAE